MPGGAAELLGFMLQVLVGSSNVAGQIGYPRELQGIWFSDDRDGHAQCRAFRAAHKKNNDATFEQLVGSEMISSYLWHSVAEYGEGNFYKLRRLSTTGAKSWRIEADVGIDSYPDQQESEPAIFEVKIAKGKLLWLEDPPNDRSGLKDKTPHFFRCSSVPESLRR